MRLLIACFCLIFSVSTYAQSVKGIVVAEKDLSPVEFASVGLQQMTDSAIIAGVITLTGGGYTFENVKPGDYLIKVSYVGYSDNYSTVAVKEGNSVIIADTIYLKESAKDIEEVTVTAERIKGKELVDRTVYSIPPHIANTSSNGYDILKKIPQVTVDFQNNITLNGSSNFIIQVDGRQRDKEYLARLLPEDIENIEIINNPSGKYEGNIDGVINIILKKEARYGINGAYSTQAKFIKKPTVASTASLDYSIGTMTFYITGLALTQKLDIGSNNYSDFTTVDSVSNSIGGGKINVSYASVNGGIDYYPNSKNMLSLNINYVPIKQDYNIVSDVELSKSNIIENTMKSSSDNKLRSNEYSVSFFYKRTFEKAVQELTTEISYYNFSADTKNGFLNVRYNNNPVFFIDSLERNELDYNKRRYVSAKFDYVHPIGLTAKLEAGYQFYYQNLDYDFTINNDLLSNNLFQYQEYRNSVYAGITFNTKKIGVQAWLRIENSNIKADSVTTPKYSCLLPTVNFQYKLSASHNIKFTYNRRITRPGIYSMNPNWKIGSYYDVSQGNPDLKPEYRDRLQLTYTWNFGSNYFSPHIYYELRSGSIGQKHQFIESPIDSTLTTFTKPFNLLSGYEFGGGVTAMLWYININARILKGHYNEYIDASTYIPSRDYFTYSITSTAFAPLTKDKNTNAFIYLVYNGINVGAQSKTYTYPLYGFGIQKKIKDHTFGFFYLLPFYKKVDYQIVETETPYYYSKNITNIDFSWYIQFMYSYQFNRGKNVRKSNRDVNIESDSKRGGVGI